MFDNGGCLIPKLIEYLNENMINMVMFILVTACFQCHVTAYMLYVYFP